MRPETTAKVMLDGNDVTKLVECAIRQPASNMRYAVLAAIWNHPDSVGRIFQLEHKATGVKCIATDLKFEAVRHDGVGGAGTIYAYTIMYHTGDKRFASAVPYASIIVELDDAPGALLAGNLLEAPYTEAKVGRRVEVVFEKLNDDITLPQFHLARTAPAD